MANRDLFAGGQEYQTYRGGARPAVGSGLVRRLLWQSVAALLIFGAIVGLYEHESALGEGVRYVVALASADQQEIMAVGNFSDFLNNFGLNVDGTDDANGLNDDKVADVAGTAQGDTNAEAAGAAVDVPVVAGNAADWQPDEAYLAAAQLDAEGDPVMILPVSGMMESAFGDIDDSGLHVDGLNIYCQGEQQVKAAAIGKVTGVTAGESIVIEHRDGVESRYCGNIQPEVAVGDTLRQGQLIGTVEEGEMLFQVLREGEAVDPFLFLQGPE